MIVWDSMPKIRRYERGDFVDYAATLEKTTSWGRHSGSELKARLEKLTRKDQVWVADIGSRAIGFMILVPNSDDSLEADWLDVHPSFQRIGVGTLLVKKAVRIAKARKMQALSVHTWATNEKMINFAFKNGFEVFERIKSFYGTNKDAIRLKKRI
jgi:ribosomal protein S18 acetylase RimI-like enzyme